MFDRRDLFVGVLVFALYLITLVVKGDASSVIPIDRDVVVIDLIAAVVCIVGGSVMSFTARGKLRFDEP